MPPPPPGPEPDRAPNYASVRTLTALVSLAYDGPERQGTFDLVLNYEAPRKLRFTAQKDLVLSSRDVFDLLLTPSRYALTLQPEEGEREDHRGQSEAFPSEQPAFGGLYWAGEALFLPGAEALASGAAVTWERDRGTLLVRRGVVTRPDTSKPIRLTYADYRALSAGGQSFPFTVSFTDTSDGTRLDVRVVELFVNEPIEPSVFEVP